MDITITVRGLEELGVGLSALWRRRCRKRCVSSRRSTARAAQLHTLHQSSHLKRLHSQRTRQSDPCQHRTPRPPTAEAAHDTPPWSTAATPATDTTPMNTTPTHNATPPKPPTLEDVRAVLAQKSAEGRSSGIQALLVKYGAKKLSGVDPARYAELLRDAEVL